VTWTTADMDGMDERLGASSRPGEAPRDAREIMLADAA